MNTGLVNQTFQTSLNNIDQACELNDFKSWSYLIANFGNMIVQL